MSVFFSLVSLLLIFGVIVGFWGLQSSKKNVPIPKKDGILYIKMEGSLVEDKTSFYSDKSEVILHQVYEILNRAIDDERIVGLVIKFDNFYGQFGDISELCNCLENFKGKGKFITCYSDCYGAGAYLLASIANEIILSPAGGISYLGFSSSNLYKKDFFDKIGIRYEVFKVGEYKSASEPYTSNSMSNEDRQQRKELLEGWDQFYVSSIAKNRNLLFDEAKNNLDKIGFKSAIALQKENFVTKIEHFHFHKYMENLSQEGKKYKIVKAKDYWRDLEKSKKNKNKNKIVILPLVGIISSDKKDLNSKKIRGILTQIKKDRSVQAVVLKIDSPGGDVIESENLYEEIKNLNQIVPTVTYIANCAASGGYYISNGCDTMIANPTCVTGSIGIFGMFLKLTKLRDKLGLTLDCVKTSPHADLGIWR
ncbi:MAG: S49 family peptidase, partial [Cytophagales bacterium]|nr:S49 family peptidase [Cytophagales bacterium]